jgi:SAM-dependent methyltransferase
VTKTKSLTVNKGQWPNVAQQFLSCIGHPLRPIPEDIRIFRDFASGLNIKDSRLTALILGVTPELYVLASEIFEEVFAIDRTPEMIDFVWPGSPGDVFQKDWIELADLCLDVDTIFCDGGIHLLRHPDQQGLLISAIDHSLKKGGRFITRLFTPPKVREGIEDVLEALHEFNIPSMNHLKIRMGSAMQVDATSGVRLADVWSRLNGSIKDRTSFFSSFGWNLDQVNVIDLYKDSDARYHFLTVDQTIQAFLEFAPSLNLVGVNVPNYYMGNQFPVICFEKA